MFVGKARGPIGMRSAAKLTPANNLLAKCWQVG